MGRAKRRRAERVCELNFVKLMIPTKQSKDRARFAVDRRHEDQRLNLPLRRRAARKCR